MKTILIEEPGKVVIEEHEKPVRKPGEVLLKILYGGICGSDLGTYRGTFAYASYPRVPGHEFSGEIVEIDENDRGLKPGMIVTVNPYFNDGTCYSCQRGLLNCCEHNETMGAQRDGAFSEYVSVPIERVYDGKGLPAKTLALIEPFCISWHGVSRANVKEGDKVLVVGAGTIGVLAANAAKARGAEVYIADIAKEKLDYAVDTFQLKGSILNTSKEKLEEEVQRITNGNGFDVTIEAVGLPSTFQNCIDCAAYGGRVVLIGVGKKNLDFNFTIIQKKELNIFGSRNALKKDFLELIDLVKAGKVRALGASAMYGYQFYNMQLAARDNGWTPFSAMENHYNLLYREDERELLPICKQMKVSLMPYSPLAAGHLARPQWKSESLRGTTDRVAMGKYDKTEAEDMQIVKRVAELAEKYNCKMSQIAIAWQWAKGILSPIIGATKTQSLDDSAGAFDIKLTAEDLAYLEEPYVPHEIVGAIDKNPAQGVILLDEKK